MNRRLVLLTNVFLFRRDPANGTPQVLLGEKLRGWRKGIFNGFGGKVEEGESIEEAALRELREEAGVEAVDLKKVGVFWQTFNDKPDKELEVHVFTANNWNGEPKETDEMRPSWWNYPDIPYDNMWKDDPVWYPFMLEGKRFKGRLHFENDDVMLTHDFHVLADEESL